MPDNIIQPNEHLLAIHRVWERMDERKHYVCLDRNERVTPFAEDVFRDMLATFPPDLFNSYPDPSPLYQRLARTLDLPGDYLYLTPGSDAAIRMTFQTYVRPGDTILMVSPTYAMYPIYTAIFKGVPRMVDFAPDLSLDVPQIENALTERPRILGIPNPNQPTGTTFPAEVMRRLIVQAAGVGTLVVVDEAYYPFYPHSVIGMLREFPNLVVTRTFSKVYGLAGLRLGYLIAHPQVIDHIHRIRGAHEVSAVAIAAGSYMLDHPELAEAALAEIEEGRRLLVGTARDIEVAAPDCPANFQLLRFPDGVDVSTLIGALKDRGYLVKGGFDAPALRQCIRVTLAGPEIIRGFCAALREALDQQMAVSEAAAPRGQQ